MENTIKISKNLSLPIEIVTQTISILAKRRAGKSYLMRRIVEQLFKAKQQVVLIDPKGDQWGIRSTTDGKKPGLPIIILGGEHGDVPLEVNAGEIVAKLVVEERVSILIDLSFFRKHEVATFMTGFLENLYRFKAKEIYRTPVMVVIDEADAIAPQKPQKGEERMLGAVEDIVRRGGQRGIGCILVTQRSAVLNKNVLTQTQILVVLRTIAPQDLVAMDAWIQVHGEPEQKKILMSSLPSLPVGDAWFWSPGFPTVDGIFKRVHVLPIETFDSGATPEIGKKPIEPKNLADIDINVLKHQMASTIEKVKENDPRILKKKISELELEIKNKNLSRNNPKVNTKEDIDKAVNIALQKKDREFYQERTKWQKQIENFFSIIEQIGKITQKVLKEPKPKIEIKPVKLYEHKEPFKNSVKLYEDKDPFNTDKPLGMGERKILIAVAQHQDGITREHLTVLTGYKRSSRDTYLQRLIQRGFVSRSGQNIISTEAGIESLGTDYELLPTGEELQSHYLITLPKGEREILKCLIDAYPETMSREQLSEITGYLRSSRDTYLQRLKSRDIIEINSPGVVKVSENLFI